MTCAKCTQVGTHATPSKKFAYCEQHAYCERCRRPVEKFVLTPIAPGLSLWVCPCIKEQDRRLSVADAVRSYDEREERTTATTGQKVSQSRSPEKKEETTLWNA